MTQKHSVTEGQDTSSAKHSSQLERISLTEAALWGLLIGIGDTYLGAFAVFLLASPIQLALVSTLPQVGTTVGQFLGLTVMRSSWSRTRILSTFAFTGALCWIGIAALGIFGVSRELSIVLLLVLTTLYFLSTGITAPSWNGLIGDGVRNERRARFFEIRNALVSICTAAGFLAGGLLLQKYDNAGAALLGFGIIFLLAGISRLVSAVLLARHPEVDIPSYEQTTFSLWQFLRKAPSANFARFAIFYGVFHIALGIAIPFFTQYMLRDLNLSYVMFMLLVAANLLAQFLAFLFWGKLSTRYGNRFLICLGAYGVSLTPLLWTLGTDISWIFFVQIFAGAVWGGFALGALNFLFTAVTPARRARCSVYLAFCGGTGQLIGGLFGGLLLEYAFFVEPLYALGESNELRGLFLISALLRVSACFFGLRLFTEISEHERFSTKGFFVRIIHSRPFSGMNFAIVSTWNNIREKSIRKNT